MPNLCRQFLRYVWCGFLGLQAKKKSHCCHQPFLRWPPPHRGVRRTECDYRTSILLSCLVLPTSFPPPLSLTSCRPKGRRTDERWRWRKEEERRVGLLPSLHHSPSSSPSSLSLSSSSSSLRSSSPFRSVVRSTRKRREEESRGQSTEKGRGLGSTSRSPFARGLWR